MLSRARRGVCEIVAGAALWRCRCEIVAGANTLAMPLPKSWQAADNPLKDEASNFRVCSRQFHRLETGRRRTDIVTACLRQNPSAIVQAEDLKTLHLQHHHMNAFDSKPALFTCRNLPMTYLTKSEVSAKFAKQQNMHHPQAKLADVERTHLET